METESNTSVSYLYLLLSIGRTVSFVLPFTKNATITIILWITRLSYKCLEHGYVSKHLKSSLSRNYILYWDLIEHYEPPLPTVTCHSGE